uniref:Uncharacterized protein n=1 Tax=Romanomermis culicivorax TaxID=13658 RepID=A0A915IAG6_ROMCU
MILIEILCEATLVRHTELKINSESQPKLSGQCSKAKISMYKYWQSSELRIAFLFSAKIGVGLPILPILNLPGRFINTFVRCLAKDCVEKLAIFRDGIKAACLLLIPLSRLVLPTNG